MTAVQKWDREVEDGGGKVTEYVTTCHGRHVASRPAFISRLLHG